MFKGNTSRVIACLFIAVGLFGFSACSESEGPAGVNPTADAPTLPDMSTMMMDLSFFGVDGVGEEAMRNQDADAMLAEAGNRANWINAVVRLLFVQLSFYDALEEPVVAFALAIHSIPQPQDDGSWLWTYVFVDEGVDYSIFLYGLEVGNRVEWRMEVSTNSAEFPLDRFVWFDGESMKDDSGGFWQFYAPVLDPPTVAAGTAAMTPGVPVIRMDWSNVPAGSHTLTILNNHEGGEDEGDTIVFAETPSEGSIVYTDVSKAEDHNITWYFDGSGSLRVPDYNNYEKACWDTQQFDVMCP